MGAELSSLIYSSVHAVPPSLVLWSLPAQAQQVFCVVLVLFLCPECLWYPRNLTSMSALAVLPATPCCSWPAFWCTLFPYTEQRYCGNEPTNQMALVWPRFQGGTPYCDPLYHQHWIKTLFQGQWEAPAEEVHGGKVKSLCNIWGSAWCQTNSILNVSFYLSLKKKSLQKQSLSPPPFNVISYFRTVPRALL